MVYNSCTPRTEVVLDVNKVNVPLDICVWGALRINYGSYQYLIRGFGRQSRFLDIVQVCKDFEVWNIFLCFVFVVGVMLSRSMMCWHVLPEFTVMCNITWSSRITLRPWKSFTVSLKLWRIVSPIFLSGTIVEEINELKWK